MGQSPKFEQGIPLPPQVLEERRLQKEQMQDASGDPKNVMRGQQPSANASGVLTEGLREAAEQGRYPDLDRFNRALTRVYKKRILLAQELFTEERLLKVMGRGNKVKVRKFKAADLRGNTDVRLELDSGLIKTKSGQAQMLQSLVQNGFFEPGKIPPTTQQEILERLGMTSFTNETNHDVDRAEAENMAVASGDKEVMTVVQNPETGEDEVVTDDPLFRLDDHAAHHQTHRQYILSPEFKALPMEAQVVLIKHDEVHQKQIDEAPPDIRDYIQIDKLLVPGVLRDSERSQILTKYLGINPGTEPIAGIPSADTVVKSKAKLQDSDTKADLKRDQMQVDMVKHTMSEQGKVIAINSRPKTEPKK
jgi:hypothetical protein